MSCSDTCLGGFRRPPGILDWGLKWTAFTRLQVGWHEHNFFFSYTACIFLFFYFFKKLLQVSCVEVGWQKRKSSSSVIMITTVLSLIIPRKFHKGTEYLSLLHCCIRQAQYCRADRQLPKYRHIKIHIGGRLSYHMKYHKMKTHMKTVILTLALKSFIAWKKPDIQRWRKEMLISVCNNSSYFWLGSFYLGIKEVGRDEEHRRFCGFFGEVVTHTIKHTQKRNKQKTPTKK